MAIKTTKPMSGLDAYDIYKNCILFKLSLPKYPKQLQTVILEGERRIDKGCFGYFGNRHGAGTLQHCLFI
jgi:hypothetical protein